MRANVAHRTRMVRRPTLRPMAGQLFEVKVNREGSRYAVTIPELDTTVHVLRRIDAETAAREAIAAGTGIPINFVAVWVRD
jgi:hypothetical protein